MKMKVMMIERKKVEEKKVVEKVKKEIEFERYVLKFWERRVDMRLMIEGRIEKVFGIEKKKEKDNSSENEEGRLNFKGNVEKS